MTHAKVAHVAALLLVVAISLTFSAKDAAAQFPPNRTVGCLYRRVVRPGRSNQTCLDQR